MSVEGMIEEVQSASTVHQRRQQDLQMRRTNALQLVGDAVGAHGLDMSDPLVEEMVRLRLEEVQNQRISHAEAIAKITMDSGDFEVDTMWCDVMSRGEMPVSLWKGYVARKKLAEIKFKATPFGLDAKIFSDVPHVDHLDVNIRYACEGGFVAALYGKDGVAVGISDGENACPGEAAEKAYVAYFKGVKEVDVSEVPRRFVQLLEDIRQRNRSALKEIWR
jgi:hypothetical protein